MSTREHIRLIGVLNMIMGGLSALFGIAGFLVLSGVAGVVGFSTAGGDADSRMAVPILATIGLGVAIFFIALALPSLIGGWGLMNFKPWARILMIVVSVFELFHIPIGTVLGVYGLWALFSDEGRRLFEPHSVSGVPLTGRGL